ncbi:MAG: hypothetical protein SGPRY_009527, partial [Prymnesium sp.]
MRLAPLLSSASPLLLLLLSAAAELIPLSAVMRTGRLAGLLCHRLLSSWRRGLLQDNARTACSAEDVRSLPARAWQHVGQALLLSLQPRRRDARLQRALRTDPSERSTASTLHRNTAWPMLQRSSWSSYALAI